jgi:hypothetical protein
MHDVPQLAKQILTFLLLAFAFSCVPYYFMIHSGHIGAGNGLVAALMMWCPGFAAFATCALFRIDLATVGWNWRPARYQVWAYVIPIFYALPVYVVVWAAIRGSFSFSAFAAPLAAAFGFLSWPGPTALLLGMPCYATLGVIKRRSTYAWRGNRLAWVSSSPAGKADRLHLGVPAKRMYLGDVALSRAAVLGLQRGHAASICLDMLYPDGLRCQLHLGLAAA